MRSDGEAEEVERKMMRGGWPMMMRRGQLRRAGAVPPRVEGVGRQVKGRVTFA